MDTPSNLPVGASDEELAVALRELIEEHEPGRQAGAPAGEPGENAAYGCSSCPDPGDWIRLAGGDTSAEESEGFLAHAACCSDCARRLRLGILVHSGKVLPEEEKEIGRLASASREWQLRLACEMARKAQHRGRLAPARIYFWTGAGLAAALFLAGFLVFWWQRHNSPERLLSSVYGHTRIFALRMPGASWAAVTGQAHLRGDSSGREPADLLNARAGIERHLDRAPQDPHWLELEARSDLMEENFDPAIDILDRLLATGPVTAAVLADDASAYFQRGTAASSENDRATALDYLRRADELNPADPVVLFNEAVVMEDRGQVLNAVATWNRYLRVESDPKWQAEGRARLAALQQKLDRLTTHRSRLEQHLATPQAMRALAADPTALAVADEELSSSLLPRLLDDAFPAPAERSRGSPCADGCKAARTLLRALAASLERTHQDPWLARLFPADSVSPSSGFPQAVRALGKSMSAGQFGEFSASAQWASQSERLFRELGNAAGWERAEVERSAALQRLSHLAACRQAAQEVLHSDPQFAWIRITAQIQDAICDTGPGTATEDAPIYRQIQSRAHDHGYALLELRALTTSAGSAIESGDAEETWRINIEGLRQSYAADAPPLRIAYLIAGLAEVEESTPRVHLDLLLKQEYLSALELTGSRNMIPGVRMWLAAAAIRAGAVREAEDQMRQARSEQASFIGAAPFGPLLAQSQIALANFYLGSGDLKKAGELLDSAHGHLAGDDNFLYRRAYAAARGQLELQLGLPQAAEATLRGAIADEERQGANAGTANVVFALENRDLYSTLAAVWLAQKRPGEEILALWERYRLRILGKPVPACADERLDCLRPALSEALDRLGGNVLFGHIVLVDRVLVYRATAQGVVWRSLPLSAADVLAAVAALERAAGSPSTSRESVDLSAQRVGEMFFPQPREMPAGDAQLLLEPDPLLGNLPWAAVEVSGQPAGLEFNIEETPSLLLAAEARRARPARFGALVIGASAGSGQLPPLPEAATEAREVARFVRDPHLLLGDNANGPQVAAALASAGAIHFAGHAVSRRGETRLVLAASPGAEAQAFLDNDLLRKHPPAAARLAVFSACSTGKREQGWNHDMGDIVNTLAALGVPEVVATRWPIDSSSAVPMMDAFYGGLSQGLAVSTALKRARLSLSRDPHYKHPYYWAAYYASGTGSTDLSEVLHGNSE
jgi:CHAT domain-containing protein/tetratricopeptide (TPR) repeat protein